MPVTDLRHSPTTPYIPVKSLTHLSRATLLGLSITALAVNVFASTPPLKAPHRNAPTGVVETDGTLDTTLDVGTFTNGAVLASSYQSDGKLLIVGQFTKVHG